MASGCLARGTGLLAVVLPLLALAAEVPAHAQEADSQGGWSFHLTPYIWLPTINTTFKYPVEGGGTATTTVSSGPGDYIPRINSAVMLAGEVRYDRFSLLTDIMYFNAGVTSGRIRSFDFGQTHIPVDEIVNSIVSVRVQTTIWTMEGGYTVAEGHWGNVDLTVGFRMLAASERTNFNLSEDITRPDGSIALGQTGGLDAGHTGWNGIAGVRGRIYLADLDWFGGGRLYLPFYGDAGGGGASPTWQVFGGLGYQAGLLSLSVGYRYLSFNSGGNALVQKLNLGGPIIAADFRF